MSFHIMGLLFFSACPIFYIVVQYRNIDIG